MRKTYLLLLIALLLPIYVSGQKWSPETIPMVHLQDAKRYVCNPDNILSQEIVFKTDAVLASLEKDKGIETVVVVVKQLENDDPYQFGMDLGKKYGIGSKKQRTGLIIILAIEDRSYQILTGNGLEGTLPDAICRRIQNRIMVPELKESNWNQAILKTIESIDSYVRLDNSLKAEREEDDSKDAAIGVVIALVFGTFFILLVLVSSHKNRCPKCKQGQLRLVKQQRVRLNGTNEWCIRTLLRCPRCGHEKVIYKKDDRFDNEGMIPPIFMGGPFHSSNGGFGSSTFGGSFGGGSFGGGGSGGRF